MYLWNRKRKARASDLGELDNPTLLELLKLPEDKQQELIIIYMKVKGFHPIYNHYGLVPIGKVIKIENLFKSNKGASIEDMVNVIRVLVNWSCSEIININLLLLVKIYKFAIELIEFVAENSKALESGHTADEVRAGIENLNKFGQLNSLRIVADYYKDYPIEKAEERTYNEAFTAWLYSKERSDFDRAYNKIVTTKT